MSEELKTYDFPVDHGDFTSTLELFYLKSDVDERIRSMKQEIGELKDKLRHYPIMVSIIEAGNKKIAELEAKLKELGGGNKDVPAKTPTRPTKPSMKLTEFEKLVHKFLREAPNECYGIDVMYDEFVRHKSSELDEFIRDYHKQGKTPEQTAEDIIEGLYYNWYHRR